VDGFDVVGLIVDGFDVVGGDAKHGPPKQHAPQYSTVLPQYCFYAMGIVFRRRGRRTRMET
jgi:hypothetical protein